MSTDLESQSSPPPQPKPKLTFRQKVIQLLLEVADLKGDWEDLGWNMDGAPESEKCTEFETKLMKLQFRAHSMRDKLIDRERKEAAEKGGKDPQ